MYNLFKKSFLPIVLIALLALSGCSVKKKTAPQSDFTPDYDSYNTYAFFGVDSRAGREDWKEDTSTGTEGAPSSDVIMLVKVDDDNNDVKVVSVYRDTMLDVAGDGTDFEKCNTAYRDDGAYGAIDMLERNLDLRITGYVAANFLAVADAIDVLGGVEVDVEDEGVLDYYKDKGDNVVDIMNNLIDEMNKVYDENTPHLKHAGKQTLTGLQAVAYSRVRYTEGTDVKRSQRQRNVLLLFVEKLKNADEATQIKAMKKIYEEIDSDITEGEMKNLFDTLMDFDMGDMEGFPYYAAKTNDKKKGTMYVPCDLNKNVTKLHKRIYKEKEYVPNETVQEYNELIIDETGLEAKDADEDLTKE